MPTNYWLKPIRTGKGDAVDRRWIENHPWLLDVVGSSFTMNKIRADDFVIFYAKGHQQLAAVE